MVFFFTKAQVSNLADLNNKTIKTIEKSNYFTCSARGEKK